MKISNFFSLSNRLTSSSLIIKQAKNNNSVSMESDTGSNTNIDVNVMPETSTDSHPNVPESASRDLSSTINDDSLFSVHIDDRVYIRFS